MSSLFEQEKQRPTLGHRDDGDLDRRLYGKTRRVVNKATMNIDQCERVATHDSHKSEGDVSDVGKDRDELESKTNGADETLNLNP